MIAVTGSYEQISLGVIVPSTTNPRKSFDDAGMADLTASVREAGVQSPILLRPRIPGKSTDGIVARASAKCTYEIVCGERRFRAAKAAGLETIPAIVRELDDETAYQAQIIENLQREDLGPMEEAESYGHLARAGGVSSIDIAAKVGKSPAYVHQRLQLIKLVDKAKKALASGTIPLGHALEIAKLTAEEQPKALEECTRWQLPSLPRLREWIQQNFRLELAKAPFSLKDAELNEKAGACVDCPKRTGADSLLFDDVKAGDQCLDAKCFRVKVTRLIQIRGQELTKTQGKTLYLSTSYYLDKSVLVGTLSSKDYNEVTKQKPCDAVMVGILVDGPRIGQKLRVCIDKKCKVHGVYLGSSSSAEDADKRKKQAAKARRDSEARVRTAKAIVDRIMSSSREDVDASDIFDLADYAFERMDHMQDSRLAGVLGWDKALIGYRNNGSKRSEKLAELGVAKAAAIAVMATVARDLTVQTYDLAGKNVGLNALAKRRGVDVAAIAAEVDAEIKAKADRKKAKDKKLVEILGAPSKKAAAKKVAVKKSAKKPVKKLSAAGRKQIAAAMKKRWAASRKKAAG